jgi:L-asparaginase
MHDPNKTVAVSARHGAIRRMAGFRRGTLALGMALATVLVGNRLLAQAQAQAAVPAPAPVSVAGTEARPGVVLFTTGGTIQSRGAHRLKLSEYSDGRVPPAELLEDLPELKDLAHIEVVEISNVGSGNMSTELLLKLARGLNAALARPDVSGAVVTHGTGTLEETAYFLHLVVRSDKPVVVVGAMRPFSAVSRDGPLNLYHAVRTAVTADAVGKGVLVLLDDTIHSARFVTKGNTTRVETFVSREIGPLGYADATVSCSTVRH